MQDNILEKKYIICPKCEGRGKSGKKPGFACEFCQGAGLGVFCYEKFFYWGRALGRALIELKHIRNKAHALVDLISFAAGFTGLLALGFWAYGIGGSEINMEKFAFWRVKHPLILIFWISLLFDMFIIYRMSEQIRKRHRIKPLGIVSKRKPLPEPDDWESLKKADKKSKIDVSRGYGIEAEKNLEQAFLLASSLSHARAAPIHLFFTGLEDKEVAAVFSRLNVPVSVLTEKIKEYLEKIPEAEERTELSIELKEVLIEAYLDAMKFGQKKVSPKNFIVPIIKKDKLISELLYELEVDHDKIFNVILWFVVNEKQVENYRLYKKMARFKPSSNMDRAYTAVATPTLNNFGYDLTVAAKWGRLEYCVARNKELENIIQDFESGACGVILTGPAGVGKNSVVDGFAQLMVKEDVPPMLKDKRLIELDAARLVSGASPSQTEGRLMAIVDEIVRAGNIILYIANIENISGITSGEEESLDLSEVLAGAVERGSIYCLASSAENNYIKYIEGKPLGNVMSRVKVEEPQGNQAIQIVESKIGALEAKHKIFFSYNAVEEAIRLSQKYIHDKYLPEKAINILDLSAVKVLKLKGEQSIVDKEDVALIVSEDTGIPIARLSQNESERLLNLEYRIHERMVNQKEAVKMVSASLRRARAEMREDNRPIASFLFMGPTGVGKTELAKTAAEIYFGKEKSMIRLDMSEYQHPDSISKMLGNAQGALGYLTEAVRKSPFSLILLDEMEKAHPDILNLFLQIMDDGRLTDGQGRTIDFTNSIIIATSNIGAVFIQEEIFKGTDLAEIREELINEHLVKQLRPEFVNRFDGVIVFEPLSREHVVEIARLMCAKIERMLNEKGIYLVISEEGLRKLARDGYDPKFGARPLRRLLQDRIDDKIASLILEGGLKRRDTVVIDDQAEISVEKGRKL